MLENQCWQVEPWWSLGKRWMSSLAVHSLGSLARPLLQARLSSLGRWWSPEGLEWWEGSASLLLMVLSASQQQQFSSGIRRDVSLYPMPCAL